MCVSTRGRIQFPSVLLQHSGVAPPHPVENQMLTCDDSGQRGFKSCPEYRSAATIAAIELVLKGFAGARNQHYLQLWRPAA
jgi:hypothetical protein